MAGRVGEEHGGVAGVGDLAAVQDGDVVGLLGEVGDVVGGQQDPDAAPGPRDTDSAYRASLPSSDDAAATPAAAARARTP